MILINKYLLINPDSWRRHTIVVSTIYVDLIRGLIIKHIAIYPTTILKKK
jgi:hypothetical protein